MIKLQYIFASRLCVPFSHFMFSAENFTADFVVLHFFIAVGKGLRNVFYIFALKYHSSPSKNFKFSKSSYIWYNYKLFCKEGVRFAKVFLRCAHRYRQTWSFNSSEEVLTILNRKFRSDYCTEFSTD
jgi:hypothetical protein